MSDYPTPTAISQAPQGPAPTTAPPQQMSPYQTPSAVGHAPSSASGISPIAIQHLVRTRKWVRLCSVLGFIGAGFLLLGGLFMMLSGGSLGASSSMRGAAYGAGFIIGMGLMYLVMAVLYIYPSLRLWQYASSISRLEATRSNMDLETALDRQRSFWKYVGLMITITLVIYIGAIVIVFLTAMSTRLG